jgi:hypothetical protein
MSLPSSRFDSVFSGINSDDRKSLYSILYKPSLLEYLQKHWNETILISVKEDAAGNLPSDVVTFMAQAGSKIGELRAKGSYIAIFQKGRMLLETINNAGQPAVYQNTYFNPLGFTDLYGYKLIHHLKLRSQGAACGPCVSNIFVEDKDYSLNNRGLNIVVLDDDFEFIDRASYDTAAPPPPYSLPLLNRNG